MRRRERPGRRSLFASAGVHVVAVVLAWLAQIEGSNPEEFISYQITYVSPPPVEEAPEPEPDAPPPLDHPNLRGPDYYDMQ